MLLFLVALLIWLPALAGWSLPWAWLRARLGGPGPAHLDSGDGVAALAILAGGGVLLNFVWPLNATVSLSAVALGWLLAGWRWRLAGWARPTLKFSLLAGAAVLLAALLANFPPDALDSGLYHLQGIAWAESYPAPFGLANLHGRLAFNTTTAPLAALTQLVLWDNTPTANRFLLGALFVCIYLAELLAAWRRPAPGSRRATIFLTLGAVVVCSTPVWSTRLTVSINSPNSDWPILVLTLLALALTLRALDEPAAVNEALAGTTLIAALALTIKLSALPLVGLPLALVVYARRGPGHVAYRPLGALALAAGLGLGLPWLARSLVLSGCLAYPVPFTCLPALPWTVAPAGALSEAKWIVSWARMPGPNLAITLHGWGWLPSWWASFIRDPLVIGAAAVGLWGLASACLAGGRGARPKDGLSALVVDVPLLVGLAAWFFSAPDVRFAAGYLWGAALVAAAGGWQRLSRATRQGAARWLWWAGLGLAALGGLWLTGRQATRTAEYFTQAGPAAYVFAWPAVFQPPISARLTLHGDVVAVPADRDECWLTPPPCTPYFNEYLQIDYDPSGAPRRFSIAPAP